MNPDGELPLSVRLGCMGVSTILAVVLAEGVLRYADGGALSKLDIFTVAADGRIVLQPNATSRVRRADGGVFEVHTDADGMRVSPPGTWMVVGDSQVFGMGVEDTETFAARAGLRNAGVPSYGLPDALAQAETLLPRSGCTGLVVVVNQANDWDEGLVPVQERAAVRGGWLLTREGAAHPLAEFWSSPLSHSHGVYLSWMLVANVFGTSEAPNPLGLGDPEPLRPVTRALAEAIRSFAQHHSDIRVVPVFLPVDAATSEARAGESPFGHAGTPWTDTGLRDDLRAALGELPLVDLLPALAQPDSFLAFDYHLSAVGHARVAAALTPELSPLQHRVGEAP